MSFFDETKNAGLVLLIIALLGIILAIVAVFALDGYKDLEMWKKVMIIVGAVLVATSVNLIRGNMSDLTDGSLPEETEQEILDIIRSVPDVFDPHNLRTRRIGNCVAIEAHVRMNGDTTLHEAHLRASRIEHLLRQRFGEHTHVNIHMEPGASPKT